MKNEETRQSLNDPLLRAKLTPPPLPANYLPRERLDRRWAEWGELRILQVTAGAGFGKTSFLSARARELGDACLWYTIDESDVDVGSFLAHLGGLVGHAQHAGRTGRGHLTDRADSARRGRPARDLASKSGASGDPDDRKIPPLSAGVVLSALVRAMERRGRRSMFVLDDLHLVADSPGVCAVLERLIRSAPEPGILVLSSRESVQLGLSRLQTQGRVAALCADDLRMSSEEVAALYRRRFPAIDHPPALFERIVTRTEGWAVGVEIFLQSLDGNSSAAIESALTRVAAAGTGWFAYFAEEVLRRLDGSTQDFICRCALLTRLDPRLCDAALGRKDSRALLERLCARNLFTIGGEGQPPVYRFHRLFREFLLDQLEHRCSADEVARLRRRVARILQREQAWVESLVASVEGGDHVGALRLIDRVGEGLLHSGQLQALERAVRRIPERERRRHAGALFLLGRLSDLTGRWQQAEADYVRALRLSSSQRQQAELWWLLGRLHCRRGRYAASRVCCQRARAMLGSRDASLQAVILVQLAVSACELGRLEEAERSMQEAIRAFRRRNDRFGVARTQCLLAANVCRVRGEFRRGAELVRQGLMVFEEMGAGRRICHAICMLADLMLLAGDRRGAATFAADGLRRAEAVEFPSVAAHARQTLGRLAILEGDHELARAHLEKTIEIGIALEEQEFAVLPRLGLAEIALAHGNRHAARRLARLALDSGERARTPWQVGKCHLLLGRLERSAAAGDRRWQKAEALFRRLGAHYDLHHASLLRLAAGAVPLPQRKRRLTELLAGVARWEHESLLREVEPEAGARVLAEALRLGVEVEYASPLLVELGPRAVVHLRALLTTPGVHSRAVELLSLIGGDEARGVLADAANRPGAAGQAARAALGNGMAAPPAPLRIRALGAFEVAWGAHRLTHESWRSARALRLFLLLLQHRFRWVPREVILESLWPEAEPEKGANNLRQTVFLLRGALEPHLARSQPSHYIRVRHEACRLDPGVGYEYDVEGLEGALRRAERAWNVTPREQARPALHDAISRYPGDFCAEYPYEEFAATEREYLRDRVLLALERLLELQTGAQAWGEVEVLSRRALALDPYRESHYRYLALAQLRLGHRKEALATCDAYDTKMVREMGLPPSERMRALTEEVLAIGSAPRKA